MTVARTPTAAQSSTETAELSYRFSDTLPAILEALRCSLLVSTYQGNQVLALGAADGALGVTVRAFEQPMGLAVRDDGLTVVTRDQIWFMASRPEIARHLGPVGRYDGCLLPRRTVVTGPVQGHEIAWGTDPAGRADLWFVNTAFSCLAGIDDDHHFVPRWKPPFISELAPGDRCHLNGMAMRNGRPDIVSMMAQSDEPGGWRKTRNDSGLLMDVPSGEVITQGIAMPHSPRWYQGRLFVLNSGMGRLEQVDPATGQREVVALLPGYARGLAFHGPYAFVGLSKIRESAIFGGAPIAEFHDQLKCGVGVVDLRTGATVATLEFTSVMHEIFDVQVVPEVRRLSLGGGAVPGDTVWQIAGSQV